MTTSVRASSAGQRSRRRVIDLIVASLDCRPAAKGPGLAQANIQWYATLF
jgi:hypothetical protein